jgi:hypothetical protein
LSAYDVLAGQPPGAVCEVPLGIGDGLSAGTGSQNRRVLLYATAHEHPLVGGYIGRMPHDAADRLRRLPVAGTLLELSDGGAMREPPDLDAAHSPCAYLVVDRSAITPALSGYLERLAPTRLFSDDRHDLLRLR